MYNSNYEKNKNVSSYQCESSGIRPTHRPKVLAISIFIRPNVNFLKHIRSQYVFILGIKSFEGQTKWVCFNFL